MQLFWHKSCRIVNDCKLRHYRLTSFWSWFYHKVLFFNCFQETTSTYLVKKTSSLFNLVHVPCTIYVILTVLYVVLAKVYSCQQLLTTKNIVIKSMFWKIWAETSTQETFFEPTSRYMQYIYIAVAGAKGPLLPTPRRRQHAAAAQPPPPLFIPSLTSHKRIFHHTQYGTVSLSHRRGCCKIVLQKDTSTLGTKMFGFFTDLYDSSLVVTYPYGQSHPCPLGNLISVTCSMVGKNESCFAA